MSKQRRIAMPRLPWIRFLCLGFVGLLCSLGCQGSAKGPVPIRIDVSGSSTLAPLVAEAAKRFEAAHPNFRVEVQTGGSSRGIRDVRAGLVDLGMSSRLLKETELEGVECHTIAWDGVAFVVHEDNPVNSLSDQQLREIYTGKLTNWRQVGGRDAPIVVSNRAEGRSELSLVGDHLGIQPVDFKADLVDGETQQSIKTIVNNAHAIGYTSIGAAQHARDAGEPLKLLPLGGVEATTESVRSGKFPLARPLIVLRAAAGTAAQSAKDEFLAYLESSSVDDIASSLGYVPPRRDREPATARLTGGKPGHRDGG